jgi:GntR family transcriptional regulator
VSGQSILVGVPRAGHASAGPFPARIISRRRRADQARQIADVLRQQILDGAYRDRMLPDENTLIREFDTTRNTVRAALDLVRAEGLVDRVPGLGTRVAGEKYPHGLDMLLGLAETLGGHGRVTNEVRTAGLATAPPSIARRLGLPDRAQVVYIERLRSISGLVLSLDLTYLAPEIGEPVLAEDLERNDIFVLIERITGRRLGEAEISLEAVNADAHCAELLEVPCDSALLMLERLTRLDDGSPVDLEYIRFRGDRTRMSGRLVRPVDPADPSSDVVA